MRTQADRDDDLKIGRDLERKDSEIDRLRAAARGLIEAVESEIDWLNKSNAFRKRLHEARSALEQAGGEK